MFKIGMKEKNLERKLGSREEEQAMSAALGGWERVVQRGNINEKLERFKCQKLVGNDE